MNRSKSSLGGDLTQIGRGLLMGSADIIPGVSGGTVALILGIYQRLVTAISHFDLTLLGHFRRGQWARAAVHVDLRFLVALAAGILAGVGGLGRLMKYLLENQLELTLAVFFGLILASTVVVARSVQRWDLLKFSLAVAGGLFAFWLVGQPFLKGADGHLYLFACGTVAICAMILPGISGAFILLIMGKYKFVVDIIHDLGDGRVTVEHVLTLLVFGSGCAIGLLAFSKLLRWLLARYHGQTLAVLCGFMLGSLRRIWPFKQLPTSAEKPDITHSQLDNVLPEVFDAHLAAAIALATAAMVLVFALDWLARRHSQASR